jgi:uncharacterized protein (TIGR00255 family)
MFRSMTGYGKAVSVSSLGNFIVEIHSVNKKFLDVAINLPRELSFLSQDIRKKIESVVFLGQVNINIKARFEDKLPYKATANIWLAKELFEAMQKLSQELGMDCKHININTLLEERSDLIVFEPDTENEECYKKIIQDLVDEALLHFISMKEKEGQALKKDFEYRLNKLYQQMKKIEDLAQLEPEKLKQKLLAKLQENFSNFLDNEERMMREMLIFCEKVDIQEEITRFYSHLTQFIQLLEGAHGGIGKKLDFLTQEISRELNTLGSKTNDLQITQIVIDMKTELSRIKEQIQNIE